LGTVAQEVERREMGVKKEGNPKRRREKSRQTNKKNGILSGNW